MSRALIEKLVDAMNKHGSPYLGHIEEYQAALIAAREYLAQPNTQEPVEVNCDEVICPSCCTQFRAIPVNVQRLMLDAGFEPPFTHPAPLQPAEPFNCGEAGCSEGRCGTAECLPSYKKQAHGVKP